MDGSAQPGLPAVWRLVPVRRRGRPGRGPLPPSAGGRGHGSVAWRAVWRLLQSAGRGSVSTPTMGVRRPARAALGQRRARPRPLHGQQGARDPPTTRQGVACLARLGRGPTRGRVAFPGEGMAHRPRRGLPAAPAGARGHGGMTPASAAGAR